MATRELIIDPATIDCTKLVADIAAIREHIPQRGPLEQLTAVVLDDFERRLCVGYSDISNDAFWVSGHMPAMPIMPGVLICEAAAQLFSYFVQRHDLTGAQVMGFGGLDNIRFRSLVKPGDRLVIVCEVTRVRRGRVTQCRFQSFVGTTLICEGDITGIPLPIDSLQSKSDSTECGCDEREQGFPGTLVRAVLGQCAR